MNKYRVTLTGLTFAGEEATFELMILAVGMTAAEEYATAMVCSDFDVLVYRSAVLVERDDQPYHHSTSVHDHSRTMLATEAAEPVVKVSDAETAARER